MYRSFIMLCVDVFCLLLLLLLVASSKGLKVYRGIGQSGAKEDVFKTTTERNCGVTYTNSFWKGQSKCSCSSSQQILMTESFVPVGGKAKCFQSNDGGCRMQFTQEPSGVVMLQSGKIKTQRDFHFLSSLYKIPSSMKECPFGELEYESVSVWDVDGNEVSTTWRNDYSEALKDIFVVTDSLLKILPNSEDFTGLLFKISLKCQQHKECALIRFQGEREHPIGVSPFKSLQRNLAPRTTLLPKTTTTNHPTVGSPFKSLQRNLAPRTTLLPTTTTTHHPTVGSTFKSLQKNFPRTTLLPTTTTIQPIWRFGNKEKETTKEPLSTLTIGIIAAANGLCVGWITAGLSAVTTVFVLGGPTC